MVRLLHLRELGRGVVDAVLRKNRSRRRISLDRRTLHDRVSNQAAWGVRLWPDRRPHRTEIHLPDYADRDGPLDGPDWCHPDVRTDRAHRRHPPLHPAADSGPHAGGRVRRGDHLCRRARARRAARILYRLLADVPDDWPAAVAARGRRYAVVPGRRGIQRLGLAYSLLAVVDPGHYLLLDPPQAAGDAHLHGDEGQAPDRAEPMARGLPQLELQVRADRHRGADWPRCRLVQQPVLGAVLPA